MSDPVEVALFNGDDQLTAWGPSNRVFGKLNKPVTRMVIRYGTDQVECSTYIAANTEIQLQRTPPPRDDSFATEDAFGSEESHLIGRVCDQLDRANPDLPIEDCQAIARDIIRLVREYS